MEPIPMLEVTMDLSYWRRMDWYLMFIREGTFMVRTSCETYIFVCVPHYTLLMSFEKRRIFRLLGDSLTLFFFLLRSLLLRILNPRLQK